MDKIIIKEAMRHYTVYDDRGIDDTVSRDLTIIVRDITTALPVRSILLGGGFGRGEGSVLIDQQGVRPINDYDLILVVPDDFAIDLRPLGKELAKKTHIRLVDLIPIKYSSLSSLPSTQFNYDLKYGGRLLWGEDTLNLIPCYKDGHVDLESGKTLLLNRLICAIESFSENYEKRNMTADEILFLVNQTGKIISACVESMLIKKRKYHYSIRERQKIFTVEFPEKKELQRLNKYATEFKIRPSNNVNFNPITYWKDAIKVYISVVAEYLLSPSVSTKKIKELWRILKTPQSDATITNNSVERIEIMLLLYREASFFTKYTILSRGYIEYGSITKMPLHNAGWEPLRERTVRLWHELYH